MTFTHGAGSGQAAKRLCGCARRLDLAKLKLSKRFKGRVKDDQIELTGEGETGGTTVKITYKGTIQSATQMKGQAIYQGLDENATWSATKK